MMMKIQTKGQRILVVSFSVLIITHGREELLIKCLDALRPAVPFELVLFANGLPLSESLKTFLSAYPADVKLGESPAQLLPGKARNAAMKLVTKDWVHLIDDDSYWTASYWPLVQKLLSHEEIEVLGGPDGPARAMGYFPESVSIALSSPLCTGMTFARHRALGNSLVPATEDRLTSCNLWVKAELLRRYPFPEDFRRAEETWLLLELQKHQHRMFYHPGLRVGHHRRKNLYSLLRPTLGAGYWRSRLLRGGGGEGKVYWLPSVFVLLHGIAVFDLALFWELARVYAVMVLAVSLGLSSNRGRFLNFPLVALLHYVIVFLYGSGFLLERARYEWK